MVLHHIRKIRNPHVRKATYGFLSLHGLFLALVALKTAVFHIAGLKLLVLESAFLMTVFNMVPHVTFAQTPVTPIDYSVSNSTYPVMTADGQMVVFMYYFQNESQPHTPGSNVVLSANIPAGMTYHSHEGPALASQSASQLTWNIPNNNNRFGMILLRLMVQPTASGPLTNTVTLTHANPDPVQSNNSATATVIANTSGPSLSNVDLAINKTVNRTTAGFMDDIIFTINYTNQGNQTAQGVKIYEVLPPELYIVSTSRQPSSISNNLYTFDIGSLAPGESGTITLRTSILPIVPNNHTIINYAVISSQMVEANIANNSSEVSILVSDPAPTMSVDIIAPKTTICVDETLRFTVNIANLGISNASAVSVRHDKPSTLTFVSSSRPHTNPQPGVFLWNYNTTFFPGTEGSFTFDLKGHSPGTNQSIPVQVLDNGVLKDSANFVVTVVPASMCNTITDPDPIPGCTNPLATNRNPNANQDNGTCIMPNGTGNNTPILGCTSPSASNYNPAATQNDGSCQWTQTVPGCTNPTASNYNPSATVNNGTCIFPPTNNTGTNNTGTNNTGTNNTGTNNTGTGNVGTGGSGQMMQQPLITVLPRTTPAQQSGPAAPGIPAQPSQTNFFLSQPAPRRVAPAQAANQLREVVAQVAPQTQSAQQEIVIPTTCEATMVDIYNYAKEAGLITDKDVPNLCEPFTRAKLAELMVNYALKLALVEPALMRRCTFNDTNDHSNEEKFYMALACDFGFMGVNDDGVVQQTFNPSRAVTRGELALTMARFLFGDTLKKPTQGQQWYDPSMQLLHEAFVMRTISNPYEEMLLGHVLGMMRRIDLADLLQNTKYVRKRMK